MKKITLSALAAAGLLASLATGANAADLGGNCCADLEERVAELEATTARKGNRKVSLTVSGWVAQQVMYWDDGVEANTYVGDIGTTLASNVKFSGQATIAPGWSAGYLLHLEMSNNDSLGITQNYAAIANVTPLQSFWFIKSDSLGKVSVGRQSQASDNTAILVDGSGSLVPANWVAFDVNSFNLRNSRTGAQVARWGAIGGCQGGGAWGDCNGNTQNVVRYDTPTFAGFSASASWGEDDMWDVALRYAGEGGGFKYAVAAAYTEITGGGVRDLSVQGAVLNNPASEYFQIGGYLQHVATGLFVYGAYGNNELSQGALAGGAGTIGLPAGGSYEADQYYIKGGLRQRWTSLGHTVLYGEYNTVEESNSAGLVGPGRAGELDVWGLGVVQEIDNAAMSLWLSYRNLSYDQTGNATQFEDFDYVKAGALINF